MKKRKTDSYELIGQIVMVDPSVTTKDDSAKPGIVFSISPEKRLAHIELSDGTQTEHAIEELITLAPKALIMERLLNDWDIDQRDFKTAIKTRGLITQRRYAEAMEMAVQRHIISAICTVTCHEWLKLKNEKNRYKGLRR